MYYKLSKYICLIGLASMSCQKVPQQLTSAPPIQELAFGRPEEVGMSSQRLARIDSVINDYIHKNWVPGYVSLVTRRGKIVHHKSFGMKDLSTQEPMSTDDIFRIMSMTKPITSVAVMMLYEEGKFLLDDPVSRYIPGFKNASVIKQSNAGDTTFVTEPATSEVTIRHLLSHTAGIPYSHPLYKKAGIPDLFSTADLTIDQTMPRLASQPLMHHPGEKWTYGLNLDMLGYLIEVVSGMSLADFLQKRIFEPLGMEDTHFYLPEGKVSRLVPLYQGLDTGGLVKAVDNPAHPHGKDADYPIYGAKKYHSGGAGLSSTAMDYAKFMQMLINGGEFNGNRLLSRKSIELMTTNQIGDFTVWETKNKFGFGFEIVSREGHALLPSSLNAYGWSGLYLTQFLIDPTEEITAIFLTQLFPHRRDEIKDKLEVVLYQAIID